MFALFIEGDTPNGFIKNFTALAAVCSLFVNITAQADTTSSDFKELSLLLMPTFIAADEHQYAAFRKTYYSMTPGQIRDSEDLYATNDPGVSFELTYDSDLNEKLLQSASLFSTFVHTTGHHVNVQGNYIYPIRTNYGAPLNDLLNGVNDSARSVLDATVMTGDYTVRATIYDSKAYGLLLLHGGLKTGYVLHRLKTTYKDASSLARDEVKEYNDVYGIGPKLGITWKKGLSASNIDLSSSVFTSAFIAHHRSKYTPRYYSADGGNASSEYVYGTDEANLHVLPVIDFDLHASYPLYLGFQSTAIDLGYKIQDWMNLSSRYVNVDHLDPLVRIKKADDFILHGPYVRFTMSI
ncbi:MAG: hypothetical protein CMF48_06080 [Legionellales bacterium]|nr:hypothetical protein [Legionellales bacterium]